MEKPGRLSQIEWSENRKENFRSFKFQLYIQFIKYYLHSLTRTSYSQTISTNILYYQFIYWFEIISTNGATLIPLFTNCMCVLWKCYRAAVLYRRLGNLRVVQWSRQTTKITEKRLFPKRGYYRKVVISERQVFGGAARTWWKSTNTLNGSNILQSISYLTSI